MRVLILSVTAGYGHHATAQAVKEELDRRGATTEIMDIYQYINRAVRQTIDKGYLFSSKRMPELYRLCYGLAESHGQSYLNMPKINIITIVNALGSTRFDHALSNFAPDMIVCTHVFAAQLMDEMKRRGMVTVPVIGIVTDYTLHPYWESVARVEWIVLASEQLMWRAQSRGIAQERLLPLGIPIHPKFNQELSRQQAQQQLGLDPDKPAILLMGGSMGHANTKKLIQQLITLDMPLQLLAVCGNNKKQFKLLNSMLENWQSASCLYPFGFVNNVEVLMSAADCIVTKPGGLTVSEALAKCLPMILVDPIPGHEERNVEFLLNNGIAALVSKTFPIDEAIYQLFQNKARLQTMRSMMQSIRHSDATQRLADFILQENTPAKH